MSTRCMMDMQPLGNTELIDYLRADGPFRDAWKLQESDALREAGKRA